MNVWFESSCIFLQFAKAEENNKWVGHNYERLVKKYNDKWVAVLDMQLVDSDKDLQTLVSRLRKELDGKYSEAAIKYVS